MAGFVHHTCNTPGKKQVLNRYVWMTASTKESVFGQLRR